ncbi:LysR family transcriptional regulator [Streptomyces werraensis]|nr:LysR family transcriptional regulator [Streptomyces werraensis]
MPAPAHVEPRLLRAFVTVAEELHFTRAAARLHIAQQALSRDVRRLERELGCELFVRSTRRVTLTADGERLLPYARAVLQSQDDLLAAAGQSRPLLVDLNSPGLGTHREVLHRARERAPGHELMARYESGLTWAAGELLAGRLDASFGRFAGLAPAVRAGLDQQPVRYEPMAVVLPEEHALAGLPEVPLAALAGETVYAGAGNTRTEEWTDLARRLFDGRGIALAPPAPLAVGGGGVPAGDGTYPEPDPRRGRFSATSRDRVAPPGRAGPPLTRVSCVAEGDDPPRSDRTAQVGGRNRRRSGLAAASRGLLDPRGRRRCDGSAPNVSLLTQKVGPQTHNLRVRYIRCPSTV